MQYVNKTRILSEKYFITESPTSKNRLQPQTAKHTVHASSFIGNRIGEV